MLREPGNYELFNNQFHLIIRDAAQCKIDHGHLRKCKDWRFLIILAEPVWRELDPSVEIPFVCKKVDLLECGCAIEFSPTEWTFFARNSPHMRFYAWEKNKELEEEEKKIRKRTPIGEALRTYNIFPIPSTVFHWADKVEFRRVENRWEYRYAWIRNGIPSRIQLNKHLWELHETVLLPYERIQTARSISKLTSTLQNALLMDVLELIATYV